MKLAQSTRKRVGNDDGIEKDYEYDTFQHLKISKQNQTSVARNRDNLLGGNRKASEIAQNFEVLNEF